MVFHIICTTTVLGWWRCCGVWWKQRLEKEADTIGVFIPKEQNYQPVQERWPAECREKIFLLCPGKENDQLPHSEWIHRHKLPQIQHAKREKRDLHVVWLDLAITYGSVTYKLIEFALEYFYIRNCVRNVISNLHMAFTLEDIQQYVNDWSVGLRWDMPSSQSCLWQP